jgi:hypothetical protein
LARQKKPLIQFAIAALIAVVFGLGAVVMTYVVTVGAQTNADEKVTQAEKKIKTLKAEAEKLKQQLAAQPDLSNLGVPTAATPTEQTIAPGKRAIAVSVENLNALQSFIKDGDRVDLIGTFGRSASMITQPLAQQVKVLSLKKEGMQQSLVLEVTPKQAERILLVGQEGKLQLALSSPQDTGGDWPTQGLKFSSLLGQEPPSVMKARVPAPSRAPAPAPPVVLALPKPEGPGFDTRSFKMQVIRGNSTDTATFDLETVR